MYISIYKTDGLGCQLKWMIRYLIYVIDHNHTFVFQLHPNMEHNYTNDENYLKKIENLLNISVLEQKFDCFVQKKNLPIEKRKNIYTKIDLERKIREYFTNNQNHKSVIDNLQIMKEVFRSNKSNNFFNNNKKNIAIHIRRLNKHDTCLNRKLFYANSNEFYLEKISFLKTKYQSYDLCFHIYSQNDIYNSFHFEDFKKIDNLILHIDDDLCDTFQGLVFADVLVCGRSGLSYTAARLSNGEIYYDNKYFYKPLSHWNII